MDNIQKIKTNEQQKIINQKITVENRKKIIITGVEKLISIKPELLQAKTSQGTLIVTGSGLQMEKMDSEAYELIVSGNIDSIKFSNVKESFLKRIFK